MGSVPGDGRTQTLSPDGAGGRSSGQLGRPRRSALEVGAQSERPDASRALRAPWREHAPVVALGERRCPRGRPARSVLAKRS